MDHTHTLLFFEIGLLFHLITALAVLGVLYRALRFKRGIQCPTSVKVLKVQHSRPLSSGKSDKYRFRPEAAVKVSRYHFRKLILIGGFVKSTKSKTKTSKIILTA